MGPFLALLSAFFLGTSNVYIRKGMEEIGVDKFTGHLINLTVNLLVGLAVAALYLALNPPLKINWPGIGYFMAAGFLTSFVGLGLLFIAIEMIGATRSTALKITTPAFTVLLGVFVLGEYLSLQAWLGIMVILIGVLVVSDQAAGKSSLVMGGDCEAAVSTADPERKLNKKNRVAVGIVIGLIAGFFFGLGNISRKVALFHFPEPIIGIPIAAFAALYCVFMLQLWRGKFPEIISSWRYFYRGQYMYAGLQTSLGLYSIFFALKLMPVSIANSIGAAEALFAMLVSYFLFKKGEKIGFRAVAGTILITTGVVLLWLVD